MRGSGARKAGLQILIKVLLFSYLALFYPPSTSFPGTLILLYYFLSVPARVFFSSLWKSKHQDSVFFSSRHFLGEGLGSSFQSFCLDESFTSELRRERGFQDCLSG